MNPAITVLMPVYNGGSHIAEAIRSILNQQFANFELLIIEDGSTDGTMNTIQSLTDPRIRLLEHSRNLGLVASLNQGITVARGTYIARMDADDISSPNRLGLQYDFLEKNPECAMCGTAVNVIGTTDIWRQPTSPQEVRCELLFRCCFAHPTVMMRREVLVRHHLFYDPLYEPAEDYNLWVRMSQNLSLANLPMPLLRYRLHENQVSKIREPEQREKAQEIQRRQLVKLGIEPTKAELDLHYNPWVHLGTDALRLWLKKLLEANQRLHVYPDSLFRSSLVKYDSGI